ncbi:hypothetical protein [Pseudochrobactrum sp. MP213Fo]|uniref:hypothetical protein n=1 Tax=Pseudochrobactrum sp. MP213Fo TaxID=3022250 RepID=UPI003BA3DC92
MAALVAAEIKSFYLHNTPLEQSTIIAQFNVRVGDFLLHKCLIKRRHDDGGIVVQLPGKGSCGISIALQSETRDAIEEVALSRYRLETGEWI